MGFPLSMTNQTEQIGFVLISKWFYRVIPALVISLASQCILAQDLTATNTRVRMVPPGSAVSAVFVDLTSQHDDAVIGVESPAAVKVEMHLSAMQGGIMQMRKIEQIPLPAGATVSLEPGGLHLMLIGLVRDLHLGETIALRLRLRSGKSVTITARVSKIMPAMGRKIDVHGKH